MASKQHDEQLQKMDLQLRATLAASRRACSTTKGAIENICGHTLASTLKGKKPQQ